MKSAYELAMERLNKMQPSVKLTAAQKKEMAELDAKCAAKIAERRPPRTRIQRMRTRFRWRWIPREGA